MSSTPTATKPASPWIVSPLYDLGFFFGGAILALAFLGLTAGLGVSIVAVFWFWLAFLDGPHIGATFTRTYVDRDEWRRRGRLLGLSLLILLLGPAVVLINVAAGSEEPFALFLGFANLYAFHHVVRQHYGFLALYKAKGVGVDRQLGLPSSGTRQFHLDKWFIYLGCWLPYGYLLLHHPAARKLLKIPETGATADAAGVGASAIAIAWAALCLGWLARAVGRGGGAWRRPPVIYPVVTVALYGLIYYLVATLEPIYATSRNPDQDFLLLTVMTSVIHGVQYVGLVWFHNARRYARPGARERHGFAEALNRTAVRFAAGCLVFTAGYAGLAVATGIYPAFGLYPAAPDSPIRMQQVLIGIWWGLALHHYIVDQVIWRIRGDAELTANLGLA